jgi:hypothetical protein
VWFPYAIPKHAFIVWLAVQDRLITGARIVKWGYKKEVKCCFSRNQIESMEYLFFECSFSYRLWNFCMLRCQVNNSSVMLDDVLKLGIRDWETKTLKGLLCCLVLDSVICNIWHTINEIKHLGQLSFEEQILKKVFLGSKNKNCWKGEIL